METRLNTEKLTEIETELLAFAKESILAKGINIQADTVLKDIGIDSYSVIEMVLFIERKFGVVLPESMLIPDNLKSINALSKATLQMI
jgi:acyl carrier protein